MRERKTVTKYQLFVSPFVHWQAKTSHKSDGFPSALPGASQLFMETVHRTLMCPSPEEADGGL